MPNYIFSRNERFYIQAQSNFNQVPNSAGVATLANGNAFRGIKAELMNNVATLTRQDKTGTRSATIGTRGRGYGKWSLNASLVTSGVAGTVPTLDPLWQAVFGAAPTVTASTSVAYNLADPLLYCTLWSFRTDNTGAVTGVDQRVACGCVPTQATWTLGQDNAEFSVEGECKWMVRSQGFSSMNTDEQCGLTAFPSEPSAPVLTDGGLIADFTGSASYGGNTLTNNIVSAQVSIKTGAEAFKNQFGAYTPQVAEADARTVTTTFTLFDDTGSSIESLKEAAELKTPINIVYQIGQVAGNIITLNLNQVLVGNFTIDNNSQRRAIATFEASQAFGTSTTSHNELQMVLT